VLFCVSLGTVGGAETNPQAHTGNAAAREAAQQQEQGMTDHLIRGAAAATAALGVGVEVAGGGIQARELRLDATTRLAGEFDGAVTHREDRLEFDWRPNETTASRTAFADRAEAAFELSGSSGRASITTDTSFSRGRFNLVTEIGLGLEAAAEGVEASGEFIFSTDFNFAVDEATAFSGLAFETTIGSRESSGVEWDAMVEFRGADFDFRLESSDQGPASISGGFSDPLAPGLYMVSVFVSGDAFAKHNDGPGATSLESLRIGVELSTLPTPGGATLFAMGALAAGRRQRRYSSGSSGA